MIVGGLYAVAFRMGQLTFDDIRRSTLFMQNRRGHGPKAMGCHFVFDKSHPAQGVQDGILAHGSQMGSNAGKYIFAAAGNGLYIGEYVKGFL